MDEFEDIIVALAKLALGIGGIMLAVVLVFSAIGYIGGNSLVMWLVFGVFAFFVWSEFIK